MISLFISLFIKLFFLLTPFFVLSVFLSVTKAMPRAEQNRVALRVTATVMLTGLVLYFAGGPIFAVLGITLDGFRVGAGSLLFLSAVSLVTGSNAPPEAEEGADFAVVPLAIPITLGPATIGTLLVLGAELQGTAQHLAGAAALVTAAATVGVVLYMAPTFKRVLGDTGLAVLPKITGLVLSALAAQIVFSGIKGFLG